MTRKTETIQRVLQYEPNQGKHLYGIHLYHDVVQVHAFHVTGVADDQAMVLGLWTSGQQENILTRPVAIHYLNLLQQWFRWSTTWGMQIELADKGRLVVEVTQKIDRPYVESMLDQAYIAWQKKYPHGSIESWGSYAAQHVRDGLVECEMNRCEEPVVAGSTCCVEHQKFARSE